MSINRWGPYQTYGETWTFEGQPAQARLCARSYHLPILGEKTLDPRPEETARPVSSPLPCPHYPETYRCRQTDGQYPIFLGSCFPRAIHPEICYLCLQNRKERSLQEKEGRWRWWRWWRVITLLPAKAKKSQLTCFDRTRTSVKWTRYNKANLQSQILRLFRRRLIR